MNKEALGVFDYEDNFKAINDVPVIVIKKSSLEYIPLFTIAIPTYNRVGSLKETIQSALNQNSNIAYEILVVDNNPKRDDETEIYMNSIESDKINYFKNSENIGMCGNWNRLYQLAKGDWVVMLHDDDMLYDSYLTIVMETIKSLGDSVYGISPSYTSKKVVEKKNKQMKYCQLKVTDFLLYNIVGAPLGLCLKKDCVLNLGGFSNRYYPSLDYHFYIRFVSEYSMIKILSPVTAFYRIGENESLKPETLLGFLKVDKEMKEGILNSSNAFMKFLWKEYNMSFEVSQLQAMKEFFNFRDENLMKDKKSMESLSSKVIKKLWDKIHWYYLKIFRLKRLSTSFDF